MTPKEQDLLDTLLGRNEPVARPEDPYPSYLAGRYAGVGAAMSLVEGGSRDPLVVAVLLRAGFLHDEEDVRTAALDALSTLEPSLAIWLAVAQVYDRDSEVRRNALDLLAAENPECAKRAAAVLKDDANPIVAKAALSLLDG